MLNIVAMGTTVQVGRGPIALRVSGWQLVTVLPLHPVLRITAVTDITVSMELNLYVAQVRGFLQGEGLILLLARSLTAETGTTV